MAFSRIHKPKIVALRLGVTVFAVGVVISYALSGMPDFFGSFALSIVFSILVYTFLKFMLRMEKRRSKNG